MSSKRETKQKHPMNHLQSYYEPVGNQSCSLHLSSYDEPKIMQSGGVDYEPELDLTNRSFAMLDMYDKFGYDHKNYTTTTRGEVKAMPWSKPFKNWSKQALKYAKYSKCLGRIGTVGAVYGVYSGVEKIADGTANGLDIADVSVGGIGLVTAGLSTMNVGWAAAANPYVGAGVAIYFAGRGFLDLTIYNTQQAMDSGIDVGHQFILLNK